MAAAAAGAPGDGHELAIPDAGQAEVAREVGARGAIASSRKEEIEREHNERVVFGLLTVEQRDKAYALLGLVVECYKMVMATLLSVFVPQRCEDENGVTSTCSVNESFESLTGFQKFVLGWNFITLGFFVVHYWLVWRRERYLIDKLDEDKRKPESFLPTVLADYPLIESGLEMHNRTVFASAVTTMVVLLINIIATAVRVFGKFFDGFRTVTVFITNCLLVILVIERAITHAWVGMQQRHAKSCLNFQPITYNVIDRRLAERMRVKRDASENP